MVSGLFESCIKYVMNLEVSGLAIVQRRILLSDNRGCVLYTDEKLKPYQRMNRRRRKDETEQTE